MRRLSALLIAGGSLACQPSKTTRPDHSADDSDATHAPAVDTDPAPDTDLRPPPNVLVVVMDDVGVDAVSTYGVQPSAPQTPTLDRLAAEGVRFAHAWAMPVCTPARAALLTGRMPRRTGMGSGVGPFDRHGGLPLSEVTLAELLRAAPVPYATTAIGKWHLTSTDVGGLDAPNLQGFEHYRGAIANLLPAQTTDGSNQDYFRWQETQDGVTAWRTGYATQAEVDDALAAADAMPEPWFLYLAFHAAHAPYQPPSTASGVGQDPPAQFEATVRALDSELGRLLDGLGEDRLANTIVVVLGDNGTPPVAERPPFDEDPSKFTMFEGGIHVPFLVRWPGVAKPGAVSDALVHVSDVFPTVARAAGVPEVSWPEIDGLDLAPVLREPESAVAHTLLFTEDFGPNGVSAQRLSDQVAVRDERYKLIRLYGVGEALYDLQGVAVEGDPIEVLPGSPEEAIQARLAAGLDAILATMPPQP